MLGFARALAVAGAAAFAAMTFGATGAHAQLGPPQAESQCVTDVDHIGSTSCISGGTSVQMTLTPGPSILSIAAASSGNAGTLATLDYQFVVLGGPRGTAITLDVTTLMQWSAVGSGSGFVNIGIDTGVAQTGLTICTSGCGDTADEFFGALKIAAQVGVVGTIHLEADAGGGVGGSGRAFIDPLIAVDPSTLDFATYSVDTGNVGNSVITPGGVPEPASWALMLLGFGLGGTALRSRRTATRAAAAG